MYDDLIAVALLIYTYSRAIWRMNQSNGMVETLL